MREHWNWAAGLVVAQLVVVAALTASTWSTRSLVPSGVDGDITVSAVILSGATAVALLAVILLAGRSAAVASVFTLLAGLAGSLGYFWQPLVNWSSFSDSRWEIQVSTISLAAVPLVLGLLALGLRRLGKPHAID